MTARLCRGRDQPESSGGKIARNIKVARLRYLIAKDGDRAVLGSGGANKKIIKNELGMIPTGRRLIDGGFAFGKHTGQQNGAFHLSARDGRSVMNAAQRAPVNAQR